MKTLRQTANLLDWEKQGHIDLLLPLYIETKKKALVKEGERNVQTKCAGLVKAF